MDAVVQVGAAAQDQVAASGPQLLARGVEGHERRRARSVDRVVDPAEVEAVGDPPGDHVGQHAGKGVLRQRGEVLLELGRQGAEVGREQRAERVGAGEIGSGLRPEHRGGPRPVEGPLRVPCVGKCAAGHLEGEELHELDRGQRGGRDAVGQRVEGNAWDEPAPLRRGAPPVGMAVGPRRRLVVAGLVPAVRRDLGDRVDAGKDVRPVPREAVRLRQHAGHAHDGDIERLPRRGPSAHRRQGERPHLGPRRLRRDAELARTPGQELRGRLRHLPVQGGDRGRLRTGGGDLAQHEHARLALLGLGHLNECVALPAQSLARDPQAAEVELLQLDPHLARCRPPGGQVVPGPVEGRHERGVGAASDVAG